MVYCPSCGRKAKGNASFCAGCGDKIRQDIRTARANFQPIRSGTNFWSIVKPIIWILLIIALIFVVVNIVSNSGELRTSTTTTNNWWGTTHETTSYGTSGKQTASYSCPFWNRDC